MSESSQLITTTLLLEQLRDRSNQAAWQQFDERFRSVIAGAARKLGLCEADVADVAQETIVQCLGKYLAGDYDRTRGRLSSWIIAVAHNRIADLLRRKQRHAMDASDTTLDRLPDESEVAEAWAEALRHEVFAKAWEQFKAESRSDPRTILAFELVAIRGVPAEAAATECGMPVEQVYVSRNRVSKSLREVVERLTAAYEDGL